MKMNPEVKQKWIEALRSKKYQQTKNVLRDNEGFCCLGVLCDIYSKENDAEWDFSNEFDSYLFLEGEAALPEKVSEWADIQSDGEYVLEDGYVKYLAKDNDEGDSFETIANTIERYL